MPPRKCHGPVTAAATNLPSVVATYVAGSKYRRLAMRNAGPSKSNLLSSLIEPAATTNADTGLLTKSCIDIAYP